MKYFSFLGLCFDLIGAILLLSGVLVTKKSALEIGTPRLGSDDEERRSQNPSVKNLLHQSKRAIYGTIALVVGFLLQGIASWPF